VGFNQGRRAQLRFALAPGFHIPRLRRCLTDSLKRGEEGSRDHPLPAGGQLSQQWNRLLFINAIVDHANCSALLRLRLPFRRMKIYNVTGYSLIAIHVLASGLAAPEHLGFLAGATVGFLYLLFVWFLGGVYLSDVMHMGIAHKTLAFKEWFIKLTTILNNTLGIYINPSSWVNRHRHHHAFSDHENDPNKLADDGFLKTMYLCIWPYKCKSNLAQDAIFKRWTFRLVSNPFFGVFSQIISFGLLWGVVREWTYALVLWCGVRIFSLWINMVQNYWTHDRRFGTRTYDDEHDNAMNLGEWLPVTASFSASLQNNHHHFPNFLRTSHDLTEYDFGFLTVRAMRAMRLVRPTASGTQMPSGIALKEIGL
jgi:fatty-acid desaturase